MDQEELREVWTAFYAERVRRNIAATAGYVRYVVASASKGIPPIFEINHLALLMNLNVSAIANMTSNIDKHYRSFSIPKKKGGTRVIDAPVPTLLTAQQWIADSILYAQPLSDHCHSFRRKRNVISNASPHLGSYAILKMDIKDFYPSISNLRVNRLFCALGYPGNVADILTALCNKSGSIPQGAASSPALSNILTTGLDLELARLADTYGLTYSRYADDITLSGRIIYPSIILRVSEKMKEQGFEPNSKKTQLICGNKKKIVTGIDVGALRLRLPKETRREIKMNRFYIQKFGLWNHCLNTNQLDPIFIDRLFGKINFWLQIEPYSADAIKCREVVMDEISKIDEGLIS